MRLADDYVWEVPGYPGYEWVDGEAYRPVEDEELDDVGGGG